MDLKKIFVFASVFVLFAYSQSHACTYCDNQFLHQLQEKGDSSLQAMETLEIVKREMQEYAQRIQNERDGVQPNEPVEIIHRGYPDLPPTSTMPQDVKPDKSVTIELTEGKVYLGKGVLYDGFSLNDQIPGPTIILNEGDVVEWTMVNNGKLPHGVSIHAAYTQTSKYFGDIPPGESRTLIFRVTYPGVYLYHCAPGGHAIPMHTMFGQYGMIVVKPVEKQYKLEAELGKSPDVEIYLTQHEFYSSGKESITGDPIYTMFNGKLFRYVEEPIHAKPGDFVRIYFLNVGPNLISTFHIVGIIWDHVYWQGHPENVMTGGQSVLAGPTDTWVIDFRVPPDEGDYLMVTHAFGSATRGAIGVLRASNDADRSEVILSDGPKYTEEQMEEFIEKAVRVISPFRPGTPDVDPPHVVRKDQDLFTVEIIGNSYAPKVLHVAKGTTVRWINEEVFTYMGGEFSGIHNVLAISGPELFASPMLGHAETWEHTFTKVGEYEYICTPHPYMRGKIVVYDPEES